MTSPTVSSRARRTASEPAGNPIADPSRGWSVPGALFWLFAVGSIKFEFCIGGLKGLANTVSNENLPRFYPDSMDKQIKIRLPDQGERELWTTCVAASASIRPKGRKTFPLASL